MPTRSSDIGTEQDSGKREVEMTTKRGTAEKTETPAEVAAEELVAERLPDEVEASVEVNPDAVAETAGTVSGITTQFE